jgi:pentatricopeptide repeat protein
VHAYAVARDLRGAVACVEDMEAEGIVPNAATFSVVISGYGRSGDVQYVSLPENADCSRILFVQFTCSVLGFAYSFLAFTNLLHVEELQRFGSKEH